MVALARHAAIANKEKFVNTTVSTGEADYRKSKVLWHWEYQELYDRFKERFLGVWPSIHEAFNLLAVPGQVEMQLTVHSETGHHFKRHIDNGSSDTEHRVLTYVYYFTLDDNPKFQGGELIVETDKGSFNVQPRHNTIIIFPSHLWHEVKPVIVPSGKWEDGRFTLNGWIHRT